jgi:hypothetical protein
LRRGLERLDISKLDYFKSKVLQMFSDHTKPGFVLGRKFVLARPEEDAAFKEYWQSLLWFSYRSDFPPIEPTTCTSDVGWGCTLRTAQMLLANAFLHHYVGHGTFEMDGIAKNALSHTCVRFPSTILALNLNADHSSPNFYNRLDLQVLFAEHSRKQTQGTSKCQPFPFRLHSRTFHASFLP